VYKNEGKLRALVGGYSIAGFLCFLRTTGREVCSAFYAAKQPFFHAKASIQVSSLPKQAAGDGNAEALFHCKKPLE